MTSGYVSGLSRDEGRFTLVFLFILLLSDLICWTLALINVFGDFLHQLLDTLFDLLKWINFYLLSVTLEGCLCFNLFLNKGRLSILHLEVFLRDFLINILQETPF